MPTTYSVTAAPEDDIEAHHWEVTVQWRDYGKWAVCHFSQCLSRDGEWSYESSPSNRENDWKERHRFPLSEAIDLASRAAQLIVVNGFGIEHIWFRKENGRFPTEEEMPRIPGFDWNRTIPPVG
jgi:hypothetical protein